MALPDLGAVGSGHQAAQRQFMKLAAQSGWEE